MTTLVLIRDHVTGYVETTTITSDEIEDIAFRWDDPDPLLIGLQMQPMFENYDCWGDLEMAHYHALVCLHLSILVDAKLELQAHRSSPIVKSLRTILAALAYDLELRVEGLVPQITIHRLSEVAVQIDMSASINGLDLPRPQTGLKVVVDNS